MFQESLSGEVILLKNLIVPCVSMQRMGYVEASYQGIHMDRAKEYAKVATSWIKTGDMWYKSQQRVVSSSNGSQNRLTKGNFSYVHS